VVEVAVKLTISTGNVIAGRVFDVVFVDIVA